MMAEMALRIIVWHNLCRGEDVEKYGREIVGRRSWTGAGGQPGSLKSGPE